jgi:hypothetical protein
VRQASLKSLAQCLSGLDQNRSERPSSDRPAGVRPGRWSSATRPSPKATAERSARCTWRASRPRVRACAQLGDRCSASERHDFPSSESKRRGPPAGSGAAEQLVHLVGRARKYRQPDTSVGDIGADHQPQSTAIHATPAASRLDPDASRWKRGVAWLQAGSWDQAGYASGEDPHSDASPVATDEGLTGESGMPCRLSLPAFDPC